MRDDEPGPVLRRAYDEEPGTAEPSARLWERTARSLRERGLLRERRAPGPRWSVAALMAAASFAGGIVVGALALGDETGPVAPTPEALEPALAAERAQEAATEYAMAVEALVRSLDRASVGEVATGREVVRSARRAHAASERPLLVERPDPGASAAAEAVIGF